MIDTLDSIIGSINSVLWGVPMLVLLLGTHLYLTVRLRFPQRHIIKAIRLSFKKDEGSAGDVSQFSALATSLAGTIGTGNIIGVATAITMGGPGAVFWCWITGVFGIATKYSEGLLATKYRVQTKDGKMLGGPMYAIERGMKCKWLAVFFAAMASITAFFIGNTVQCNAISTVLEKTYGIDTAWTGLAIAALTLAVIVFGVKGIAKVCESLVPLMALIYVLGCFAILGINHDYIMPAIALIVKSAFTTQAAAGGFVGSTLMIAMRYGMARGLFSNESGMGSAPIVAAAAQTRNPVRQALVSSTSTFWDTVVICMITGIVLVSSILANPGIDSSAGAVLTEFAFRQIPYVGTPLLSVGIVTFAFSTILGWSYIGEKALEYLMGKKARLVYRILWVIATFVGSVTAINLVWNLGDLTNALMAIPNIVCILALSGVIVRETRKYLWEDRLDEASDDVLDKE